MEKRKMNSSEVVGIIACLIYSLYFLKFVYLPLWHSYYYYTDSSVDGLAALGILIAIPINIVLALFFTFAAIEPRKKIIYSAWVMAVYFLTLFYGKNVFQFVGPAGILISLPLALPILFGIFKNSQQKQN
jgi:hypothetical protein